MRNRSGFSCPHDGHVTMRRLYAAIGVDQIAKGHSATTRSSRYRGSRKLAGPSLTPAFDGDD